MPGIEEMEYVPVGLEMKRSRLRGLRLFLLRLFRFLVCPCQCHFSEQKSDKAKEEVIEF
jgi:hypothetical protein